MPLFHFANKTQVARQSIWLIQKAVLNFLLSMKKIVCFILATLLLQSLHAQIVDSTVFIRKQHADAFHLWEFQFYKDTTENKRIGTLLLKRTKAVYSDDSSQRIDPFIILDVYPNEYSDTITKFETERTISLSCCGPVCGSTIIDTEHFVFYSDPWSIEAALGCSQMDYTRKNAYLILDKVKHQNFTTIDSLLNNLSIDRNINLKTEQQNIWIF